MFKIAPVIVGVLLAGSVCSAAIVYEPVQYQYRRGSDIYYYGGRHAHAVADAVDRSHALRYSDSNYQPCTFTFRTDRTPAVYSDAAPYMNLSVYGYTQTDAVNEANASLPRYFRKGDLMAAGKVTADGSLVIAANAIPVPRPVAAVPTTRPSTQSIIIIPRRPAPARTASPVVLTVAEAR
jgi:hypothetical protein